MVKRKKRGGTRGGGNRIPPVTPNKYLYPELDKGFSKDGGPKKPYDVAVPPWHRDGLATGPVARSTSWNDRDGPQRLKSSSKGSSALDILREDPLNQKISSARPSNWNDRPQGGFGNTINDTVQSHSDYNRTNRPPPLQSGFVGSNRDGPREGLNWGKPMDDHSRKWDSHDDRPIDRTPSWNRPNDGSVDRPSDWNRPRDWHPDGPLNQDRSGDGPNGTISNWDRPREVQSGPASSSYVKGSDMRNIGPRSDGEFRSREVLGNDSIGRREPGGPLDRAGTGIDYPPWSSSPRNRPDVPRGIDRSAAEREAMLLREREDRMRREREEMLIREREEMLNRQREEMLNRQREEMLNREREEMLLREREERILREEKLIREMESMANTGPPHLMDMQPQPMRWDDRKRQRTPENKNIWDRLEPDTNKRLKLEMPDKFGRPSDNVGRPSPSKINDLRHKLSRGSKPKSVYTLYIIPRKQYNRLNQIDVPRVEEAICKKLYSVAGSENAESQPQLRFKGLRLVDGSAIEVKCMNRETALWLLNTSITSKPSVKLRVVHPEDSNLFAVITFSTKFNTGPVPFRELLKHQNPGLEVFSWKDGEVRQQRKQSGTYQYTFTVDGHTLRYLESNKWNLFLGAERLKVRKVRGNYTDLNSIMI